LYTATGAPVYWLIYDMAAMTGGCHYAWDCKGYLDSCGKCPGLYSSNPADVTYKNMLYKKQYLDKTDVRIVSGAEWQYRQVTKSTLFKNHTVHKILNAINSEVFKPLPKKTVREKLGIGENKKVIFFGAVYLDHKRKGFDYLFEALGMLKEMFANDPQLAKDVVLLVAGQEFERIKDKLPFDHHYMGMLDSHAMASAYQAADLFVCPSIEDSGPTMVNQSVMCGTPVVSFETGVSLDLVITGKTGYLATLRDSKDLAKGMFTILTQTNEESEAMRNNCRSLALRLFHPDVNNESWASIITAGKEEKILAGKFGQAVYSKVN
jgi:glycosyltransferase involved in cell wall biosynthesis